MSLEDPIELLGRLRLGREEYCQRLATMLILSGAYPKWNTRNRPSLSGQAFLADLYSTAHTKPAPTAPAVFVDEFDLPPRSDAERGGAPDWAVLWGDLLWMIELKTEQSSHRPDQLPHYLDLARHHYPHSVIDLTYLTPRMPTPSVETQPGESFAHVTWDQVAPLLSAQWAEATATERDVAAVLLEVLGTLQPTWAEWRTTRLSGQIVPVGDTPADAPDCFKRALDLAALTGADGQQRALDCPTPGVDDLHTLRVQVRDALRTCPEGDPARVVRPWVWSAASSGGAPLTGTGSDTGYELRVSRYTNGPG